MAALCKLTAGVQCSGLGVSALLLCRTGDSVGCSGKGLTAHVGCGPTHYPVLPGEGLRQHRDVHLGGRETDQQTSCSEPGIGPCFQQRKNCWISGSAPPAPRLGSPLQGATVPERLLAAGLRGPGWDGAGGAQWGRGPGWGSHGLFSGAVVLGSPTPYPWVVHPGLPCTSLRRVLSSRVLAPTSSA